jgi:hypothetical protein
MQFNEKGLLTSISQKEAAQLALANINEERNPNTIPLRSRWRTLNKAILKSWRFKTLVSIAGASGSAKSYILNMLRTDFTDNTSIEISSFGLSDKIVEHLCTHGEFHLQGNKLVRPALNPDYPKPILWLHFGFDMAVEVEMMRTAGIICGYNYAYLLSSQSIFEDGEQTFNVLSNEEYKVIELVLKAYVNARPNIIFFREPGSIKDMTVVIDKYANRYPNHKIGVSIDHTLLVKKENIKGDLDLNNELAKEAKDVRDIYDALVILLVQMNSEIEEDRRKLNKNLHYPTKSDIYCGPQIYQSSDFVFTAFMPESIHIKEYGPDSISTKNLIHFSMIKSRHGGQGQIWLQNDLANGQINELRRVKSSTNVGKYDLIPVKTLIKTW